MIGGITTASTADSDAADSLWDDLRERNKLRGILISYRNLILKYTLNN